MPQPCLTATPSFLPHIAGTPNLSARRRPPLTLLVGAVALAIACVPPEGDGADGKGDLCVSGGCNEEGPDEEGPDEEAPEDEAPRSEPRLPEAVPPGFAREDYGVVEVVAGETEDLTFEASAEVRSFFVSAEAGPGQFVVVLSVRAPDGTEIVRADPPEPDAAIDAYFAGFAGPALSPNRSLGRPRAAAAMIPNTPRIPMVPGAWTFRVGVFSLGADDFGAPANVGVDGEARVVVVSRLEDAPARGTIDIVLSVHPSTGLDAGRAAADPVLNATLENVDAVLGEVGVRVGSVAYLDFEESIPLPLDLTGPSCLGGDGIETLFDRVTPVADAIHVVLIDRFTCLRFGGLLDAGESLAAISNGVPGIPFSPRDGIVAATALKDEFPDDWAFVLAHEIGHFLGLFHTAEGIPGIPDNIPDTDDAAPERYLMHFRVSMSATTVTADQGAVARTHPVVLPLAD